MDEQMKILFLYGIADEAKPYVQALRDAGFDVQFHTSVDGAVRDVQRRRGYVLIVWAMWLVPGESFGALGSARHGGGSKTGECFVELVRGIYPSIPMVLFTVNRVLVRRYSRPHEHHHAWCLRWGSPTDFVRNIQQLLGG